MFQLLELGQSFITWTYTTFDPLEPMRRNVSRSQRGSLAEHAQEEFAVAEDAEKGRGND